LLRRLPSGGLLDDDSWTSALRAIKTCNAGNVNVTLSQVLLKLDRKGSFATAEEGLLEDDS
jgi:hypothetical protein